MYMPPVPHRQELILDLHIWLDLLFIRYENDHTLELCKVVSKIVKTIYICKRNISYPDNQHLQNSDWSVKTS